MGKDAGTHANAGLLHRVARLDSHPDTLSAQLRDCVVSRAANSATADDHMGRWLRGRTFRQLEYRSRSARGQKTRCNQCTGESLQPLEMGVDGDAVRILPMLPRAAGTPLANPFACEQGGFARWASRPNPNGVHLSGQIGSANPTSCQRAESRTLRVRKRTSEQDCIALRVGYIVGCGHGPTSRRLPRHGLHQ